MAQRGRPPKINEMAPQKLYNDDDFQPPLNIVEIEDALKNHSDAGVRIKVTDKHWFLAKGKLSCSGSLEAPIESVIYGADWLLAQERFVRAANRKDKNGNLAIGNIIDRAGNDVSHG